MTSRTDIVSKLFEQNKITAYDVMMLSILETLEEYAKIHQQEITWETYLEFAQTKRIFTK